MRIAVIMAAYQASRFIRRGLDSVARQQRRPDEVVVVDDGSTDDTVSKAQRWAADNPSIAFRLLRQDNLGPAAAANRAIGATSADLIAILDADDEFLPHHLAVLEAGFGDQSDAVLCFGNAERWTDDGRRHADYFDGKPIESLAWTEGPTGMRTLTGRVFERLLFGAFIPSCGTLFRRDAAVRAGLFDEDLFSAQDREFWIRLSRQGSFRYTPRAVARVWYHDANITRRGREVYNHQHRMRAVRKIYRSADALGLNTDERRATRRALAEAARHRLWWASRLGPLQYLAAAADMLNDTATLPVVLNPRHLARSLWAVIRRPDDGLVPQGDRE